MQPSYSSPSAAGADASDDHYSPDANAYVHTYYDINTDDGPWQPHNVQSLQYLDEAVQDDEAQASIDEGSQVNRENVMSIACI